MRALWTICGIFVPTVHGVGAGGSNPGTPWAAAEASSYRRIQSHLHARD
jgi:hypothetical protein